MSLTRWMAASAAGLGLFLSGCDKDAGVQRATAVPDRGPAQPKFVSAEKTSFTEVTSQLDAGGSLYAYLSTEQLLTNLSERLAGATNYFSNFGGTPEMNDNLGKGLTFVRGWLQDSGVEQISGLGMSSIAREPGLYVNKMVAHHYPGQDKGIVWTAFGRESHALTELNLLPDNTGFASFTDVDVAQVWADLVARARQLDIPQVNEGLTNFPAKFKAGTGLDFDQTLQSLAGNYGIILTLDTNKKSSFPVAGSTIEFPSVALAIVVKVKSDLIFDHLDELAQSKQMGSRADAPGLKMRTMPVPLPLPIDLRPSIARVGDYLIVATTDTLIQDIVATKSGKKPGFTATPEFAHLSKDIPTEGNSFSLLSATLISNAMDVQGKFLVSKGTMTPAQVTAMQQSMSGTSTNGSYGVSGFGKEGWTMIGNSRQSLPQLIAPMVAGFAGAAAVVVPMLIHSHEKKADAQQQTSVAPSGARPGNPTSTFALQEASSVAQ